MIQKILEDLRNASSLEEVYPTLIRLRAIASRMVHRENLSHDEASDLASHITSIRVLIAQLAYIDEGSLSEEHLRKTEALTQYTLELEGIIKEKRNDLARKERGRNS